MALSKTNPAGICTTTPHSKLHTSLFTPHYTLEEGDNMITVRRAVERDIPAILRLLVQVNMVHHNGRPDLFKGPTTKYTADELRDILKNDETPVFVCVDESDAVLGHGFCVLQHFGGQLMEELDTLYIDDICVDETARGRHVGTALYRHIVDYARALGCHNVTLNVWSCNPGAMAFYEKLGMVPYKVGMETII